MDLDDRRARRAFNRGTVRVPADTKVEVLDVYCAMCRRSYTDAADTPCSAAQSTEHLRGGPIGERAKRKHPHHDCESVGCDLPRPETYQPPTVPATQPPATAPATAAAATVAEPEPATAVLPRGSRVRHCATGRTGIVVSSKPTGDRRRPNALRHTVCWDEDGSTTRTSLNALEPTDPARARAAAG